MGFAIGSNEEKLQERAIKGHYQKVAVGCWFTSKGKSIPKMVKYEDEDGFVHTFDHVKVLKQEKKHYAGVLLQRYDCQVVQDDLIRSIILLYHPTDNTWDMVVTDP